jgi:two-component system, NtrC family, sensor kinase
VSVVTVKNWIEAGQLEARIFEPFFTTKPQGEGTGLGLSLCRRTLEEHGGTITVKSEVGHEATFHLELPVMARPAPQAEAAAPGVCRRSPERRC